MNRLVVISNRVADLTRTTQSGGLAVALSDSLKSRGGVWLGWDGETREPGEDLAETVAQVGSVTTITAPLTTPDYQEYYLGFSNSVLWPLFHYRLDLVRYETAHLKGYRRVNRRFAEITARHLRSDDVIWIHDYHLIPLARELRRLGCRQRIGFFLHIPFPPPEVLAAAPEHRWLAESLFEYDLVGFQTQTDLGNFHRYSEEHVGVRLHPDGSFRFRDRTVRADAFPIGIDTDAFASMAAVPSDEVQIDALRRSVLQRRQIIGVDRLDYSKGLPDRMKAFSRLLEKFEQHLKRVTFLQIAPPTREDVDAYADIRMELESLSGSINGRFADFNWTPIRYIHRSVERSKLAALYRASTVGLVTPLRDGMNLVAKEFVAAQDPDDPGVLVLSKFAGAAEEMTEALIVNPYDLDDMADKLHSALLMPLEERRERHDVLFERLRRRNAVSWQRDFLATLDSLRIDGDEPDETASAA
jgi:trehalose 6-phosphate synthase